ncbi:MAG: hypothetical protein COB61_003640 [Thiotrichales bacterium]|nr:hypothetical protein [Thiotrichales bacterium]
MTEFMQSLPDGWTIYLWMVAAGGIIIAAIIGIRWAYKNEQFDEDIKYLVFDENDKDKMSPEDFAKFQEVNAAQESRRAELLAEKAKAREAQENA